MGALYSALMVGSILLTTACMTYNPANTPTIQPTLSPTLAPTLESTVLPAEPVKGSLGEITVSLEQPKSLDEILSTVNENGYLTYKQFHDQVTGFLSYHGKLPRQNDQGSEIVDIAAEIVIEILPVYKLEGLNEDYVFSNSIPYHDIPEKVKDDIFAYRNFEIVARYHFAFEFGDREIPEGEFYGRIVNYVFEDENERLPKDIKDVRKLELSIRLLVDFRNLFNVVPEHDQIDNRNDRPSL